MNKFMWPANPKACEADSYVAFRGQFELNTDAEIELRTLGASWYGCWLDGEYITDGPARFFRDHPQYQSTRHKLSAGRHIIAFQVHHEGVETRMLADIPPFLYCEIHQNGGEVQVEWKCALLDGYEPRVKRINPQLGWIEWCDTRKVPENWQSADYDDSGWPSPELVERDLGHIEPLETATVLPSVHSMPGPAAEGFLAEGYGYEMDNIAARFFLRDLQSGEHEAQGVWRRYDLGRIMLCRPRFTLDLPAGTQVELAWSEYLMHGRVSPWITLSAGDSCNFDHYTARGGVQEFFPLTPKGGRYVEVHIIYPHGCKPAQSGPFIKEEFLERCYYGAPEGAFRSSDPILNRIWTVGIDTLRACAEDSLVDNPTRERGQWAGDVVSVGLDVAAAGYSDLRLFKRALTQFAQCARKDGLVSGLCPGGGVYVASYAAQWVSACVHYWKLTGDRSILVDLFTAAEKNIEAFQKYTSDDGVIDEVGWGFIDWGYVRNQGPVDIALNMHYLASLRDMTKWCEVLGFDDRAQHYASLDRKLSVAIARWFAGQEDWESIGYHRAVLGLKLGYFDGKDEGECLEFIKKHILGCFPNKADTPRLSSPSVRDTQIITPYFFHFAMPVLIERSEMDFALDIYRKCWGWMLETGSTTWPEVFDLRWSRCHQWSACPTWQISRYLLGLVPRFDLGQYHYQLTFSPGNLEKAEGSVPMPGRNGVIIINWQAEPDGINYHLESPEAIYLWLPEAGSPVRVEGYFNALVSPTHR
ncbi:MAG: family 78 glycoside hydrolase catalytic domain [Armatimonadota bacterium]